MSEVIIKPGREKSILRQHPWIFSSAISTIHGSLKSGDTVEILSSRGEFLARAAYNPHSKIACRIWTWNIDEQVDRNFFQRRLSQAINIRKGLANLISSNAMRLVHGESDGIPGLILDRYDDTYVAQFLTAGIEIWKTELVEIIHELTGAKRIYEKSDVDARQMEGLQTNNGLLWGDNLPDLVEIFEHSIKYHINIAEGHKTGFYLDQRDNRLLANRIADGRRILDCFSYTGGFAINCLAGSAQSVTLVDTSHQALETAKENISINSFTLDHVELVEQDIFRYLRTLRDRSETFDMIILDPPKFAPTIAQAERASRGYKDINMLALKLLETGGYLLTFSCSGGVSEELFQKIVAGAAQDAQVKAVILKRLHQAADHPVALHFPEGAYLKGFLIQKVE
jgi:23S rRNA (cytosine1962-C5)-methyltransferase